MLRTIPIILACSLFFLLDSRGQDVFVPRQLRKLPVIKPDPEQPPEAQPAKPQPAQEPIAGSQTQSSEPVKAPATKETAANSEPEKGHSGKMDAAKAPAAKETAASTRSEKTQSVKDEPVHALAKKETSAKELAANSHSEKVSAKGKQVNALAMQEIASNPQIERAQSAKSEHAKLVAKESATNPPVEKTQSVKFDSVTMPPAQGPTVDVQLSNGPIETASTRLADGFDFPVGKPDAEGYYRARGFRCGGHMGEDWDGVRGGDTDLKDPIYSIGDGIVVFARDVHLGWGNVVIVRHAYKEEGTVKHIDSLYGHLHSILVKRGQRVVRGQQVGTMGTAHGQYDAHLHLEIRKNIEIGMSKSKFQKNLSNYYDPSQFIASHRRLSGGGASFRVAMNTFTHDAAYHFDSAPNFSARKRSTVESSAALKRAVSSTSVSSHD